MLHLHGMFTLSSVSSLSCSPVKQYAVVLESVRLAPYGTVVRRVVPSPVVNPRPLIGGIKRK
jgi:hypothetical protein